MKNIRLVCVTWLVVTLSMAMTVASVVAATLRVEQRGGGGFTTIQPAVDAAAAGDTVLVGFGRYLEYAPFDFGALTEDTYIVVTKPNLTLMGTDRDSVIVGPEVYDWPSAYQPNGVGTLASATGLRIESMTFENIPEGIILESYGVVRNCRMNGARVGFGSFSTTGATVVDCQVIDSRSLGITFRTGTSGVLVQNCLLEGPFSHLFISQAQDALIDNVNAIGGAILQFQMFSSGTMRDCTISGGGGISILDSDALLTGNQISTPSSACLAVANGSVTATGNVFSGGQDVTLFVTAMSDASFRDNHIFSGGNFALRLGSYSDTGFNLDFRQNYWGTADSLQIADLIFDGADGVPNWPVVQFSPFLSAPVATQSTSIGSLKGMYRSPK